MRKFYEVVAKCGHVGKGSYFEGHFFIISSSASNAAKSVRQFPRVKHDHEDAILSVTRVTGHKYQLGKEKFDNNPYFACTCKQEQNMVLDQIIEYIKPETRSQLDYRKTIKQNEYNKQEFRHNKKGIIRNPYKYAKYNNFYVDNDYLFA